MEQETKICSNCKRAIKAGTFDLHESHCLRHIRLCPVCEEAVPIKEMEEHHREYHAPKPCDKCGENIPPDQLEDHLEQSCAEVEVECKYCELEVRRADYHEHTEQCGSRTDFCELCNQRVMLKEMSEHKLTKCGHMRAESPLQRYQLEGMGLVGQDGGESDSSDDFNPNYYPPHGIGRSITPPPAYEHHNDESMRVDPHWLQTVAEACGEDNLDALLAQNVFFENMRSVRSDGHHVASEPVVSHDNHVTTEESSEDEGSIVREKPPFAHERQGDNRLLDEDFSRQLAATNEQDDFYLAQRIQEREVMGHSRTLYEENRVREMAREIEGEERGREIAREVEEEERGREVEEEREKRRREMEEEEVKSKVGTAEQEELDRMYEEKIAVKQLEIKELSKKLKESTESQRLLQKHIEETKGEIDSLRLVSQLQKEDLAEGHKALWKKTAQTCSSQLADESLARRMQMKEDRLQYSHTHLEEEEPRPKTPPTQSYVDDTSEKIPCQWCEKLIPFEQVMLHQQSCYNNLFGGGMEGGRGPHLSEDTFRRVEKDDDSWQAEQFKIECQYCHIRFSVSNLTTHEALCESNPDIHLKNFYTSQLSSSSTLSSAVRQEPSFSSPTTLHDNSDDVYQAQQFSVECEHCHVSFPASNLATHEALCDSNPNAHLKKFYESQPPSSATALGHDPSLSPNGVAFPLSSSTTGTEPEPGATAASPTLLSVEKGPCEYCHQVIPLAQLIGHEARCRYMPPKPSLAPPTSSQYSPGPPPSSPTLLQESSTITPAATLTAGKRSLAIKFPGKDDRSGTTAHQTEERDGTTRHLDPVIKPANLVANGSASRGSLSLSSMSGKGEEFKGSKKRQSPSETFEPWSGVREPVKKTPRIEMDGGSIRRSHISSVTARSAATGSKSKPVYASASGRDIYGANSVETGGNVLSSAARGVPSTATKQVRESRLKTDATVKSISTGMKELALHSKSETDRKSFPSATSSKPPSMASSRSPVSRTKSLQTGNSKFQITGTKVSGTNSSPHSNATRTTGTTGAKSVGGNNSKLHTAASKSDIKLYSVPSRSSSLGSSSATKQMVTATSARGTGRGRGKERGAEQSINSSSPVLRQSSTGSTSGSVSKGHGRGRGRGSLSTQHRTSSTGRDKI